MTKNEAIERWVTQLDAIPQDWIRKIAESEGDYPNLPMWGTMWIVPEFDGEKMWENSKVLAPDKESIDLDEIEEKEGKKRRTEVEKAIAKDDWNVFGDYVDEEMGYEHNILDKDGNSTAAYIYEIDGVYVIGVHGAGWNFYSGVWDKLYDVCDLHWHTEETEQV